MPTGVLLINRNIVWKIETPNALCNDCNCVTFSMSDLDSKTLHYINLLCDGQFIMKPICKYSTRVELVFVVVIMYNDYIYFNGIEIVLL